MIKGNVITTADFNDKYKCDVLRQSLKLDSEKSSSYHNMTIGLLVKDDIVKSNWNTENIYDTVSEHKDDILKQIMVYTKDTDVSSKRNAEIYNNLYKSAKQINRFNATDKQDYTCEEFYNDKPIVIYGSEISTIQHISKKYRTNEKDGRRIVRLICLLLAWQKAYNNRLRNNSLYPYAKLDTNAILNYNPIIEPSQKKKKSGRRTDAVALLSDYKKLREDGYVEVLLPEVAAPREITPDLFYRVTFCVDDNTIENEETVLIITDFENIWEQIFIAAFKEFDVLEFPKEKDIKHGEIIDYDNKSKCGKVRITNKDKVYSFDSTKKYNPGDNVRVYIQDGKKGKVKILSGDKAERVYVTYRAVKRCSKCGTMFYAKQMGKGTGNCEKCNKR